MLVTYLLFEIIMQDFGIFRWGGIDLFTTNELGYHQGLSQSSMNTSQKKIFLR